MATNNSSDYRPTQYSVQTGGASGTLNDVAPSATSGIPVISQGTSAQPIFGTALVAGGGTGATSFTAYSPICGGTTTTGTLQSASTGQSTSGFVLTSTGASSLPTFQTVSASGAITTITGNSGGAESPSAGNFNILGTGSITVAGSANTETVQLTGLTNHAVLVGAGTATITNVGPTATAGQVLQSGGSSADPVFSTATYPSTTTVSRLLYSSSTNVVADLATANKAVLTTGATGVPVLTAIASDGQLIIGSTSGVPAAATLSAGAGVSITNGSNSITISATGSEVAWTDQSGNFTAASGSGYFITNTSTATLPASPSQGDIIEFIVDTTNVLTVKGNTGQVVRIGSAVSASAGTAASNARGDSVSLVYRSTGAAWISFSVIGTFTVT